MEFKLYENRQEFLADNGKILKSDVLSSADLDCCNTYLQRYETPSPYNYALKFTDGNDCLLVLRDADTLLIGSARLAEFAANVLADYHLAVGNCVGEAKLVGAFCEAYHKRLGGNVKQALFAGGCFWCMAKPYYEYDGVVRVLSGYAGGNEVNPTYEEVKHGQTHHKETVMLEYDSSVISYRELLDVYFDTIDPFDEYGQFVDRGDNYTCAIFTDDVKERKIIAEFIGEIEAQCKRKVQVKVLPRQIFYKAEEYHQDYAMKNPEAMEEELKSSGRLEHKPIHINKK